MADDDALPDTTDPHELLGIAEDADERSIKRAYARLIKRWRPDRAPDEFRRIHEAYEAAQRFRAYHAEDPPGESEPEPEPEPVPEPVVEAVDAALPPRAAEVAAAFRAARARGDRAGADELFARALDDRVAVGSVLEHAHGRDLLDLLTSPALTWSRIAADDDRGVVLAVMSMGPEPPTQIYRLLQDPKLVLAAEDELGIARCCLGAIAALAWRSPAPLPANALRAFERLPRHPWIDELLDRVELELEVGGRVLASGIELPVPMRVFLGSSLLARPEVRAQRLASLAADLDRDPISYLRAFDRMVAVPELGDAMAARLIAETSGGTGRMTNPEALRDMQRRLVEASGRVLPVVGLAALVVAALIGIGAATNTAWVSLLLGVAVFVLVVSRETFRYQSTVRNELARHLVAARVSAFDLRVWLSDAGMFGSARYGRFDIGVRNDAALTLLGRLAVMVASDEDEAEEDGDDDDGDDDEDGA